jgi:RNA polymerase sigma factor for flagellar operon FliA
VTLEVPEEEVARARAVAERDGRLDAMQKILVAGAMVRVPRIVRGLRQMLGGISFEDCESAGYEALVRAALRYDPAMGVPFWAFAFRRVRGSMLDAAREACPDRRRLARMVRLTEAANSLTEVGTPLAGDPRTHAERVEEAMAVIRQVTTAAVLARAGDTEDLGDPDVDVETRLVDAETRGRVLAALDRCEADERALLEALYFRGQSMHTYAADAGVHVSTVSRRHARALRRLAKWFGEGER